MKKSFVGEKINTAVLNSCAVNVGMYSKDGDLTRFLKSTQDGVTADVGSYKIHNIKDFARKLYEALNFQAKNRSQTQRIHDKIYGAF